jgi:hypothetical protein
LKKCRLAYAYAKAAPSRQSFLFVRSLDVARRDGSMLQAGRLGERLALILRRKASFSHGMDMERSLPAGLDACSFYFSFPRCWIGCRLSWAEGHSLDPWRTTCRLKCGSVRLSYNPYFSAYFFQSE